MERDVMSVAENADKTVLKHIQKLMKDAKHVMETESGVTLITTLETIRSLLDNMPISQHLDIGECDINTAKKCFQKHYFSDWLLLLHSNLSVEWLNNFPKGQVDKLFDVFFLLGPPTTSLNIMSQCLNTSSGYKLEKIALILEAFLKEHKMAVLMLEQSANAAHIHKVKMDGLHSIDTDARFYYQQWEETVTIIASLPERMANKLKLQTRDCFLPEKYIALLTDDIVKVLHQIHDNIINNKDSSVEFLSLLLGKLCIAGHGMTLWSLLLPRLLPLVVKDFTWSRLCERFVTTVPDRCLEAVLMPFLNNCKWYGFVVKFLGQAVLSNTKMKFLLCKKFILLRNLQNPSVLQNIIGYLATCHSRKPLYFELFKSSLSAWSCESSVRHTSYQQHMYLTQALLICCAFLEEKDATKIQPRLLPELMSGVQVHLDSSSPQIRKLGMVVAEALTSKLNPAMKGASEENTLKFDYEKDEETDMLLHLLEKPVNPGIEEIIRSTDEKLHIDNNQQGEMKEQRNETKQTKYQDSDSELDSDDDLEPYDLSNDAKQMKTKPPVYLRDCMEGLLTSDDPERIEVSLSVAEKLIRTHTYAAKEIAVEFCKILLHLAEVDGYLEFHLRRHTAMVALAVVSPVEVAEYLASEFYARNYNIKQRLDMLEVLTSAARELSKPAEKENPSKKIAPVESSPENIQDENWQQVVQRRIESKTRRFGRGGKRDTETTAPSVNRFAPVAGHFFFPLIKDFDKKDTILDLLGSDHMVLSRLVYSLGAIVYAASNVPIVHRMGGTLLEFIWMLRYHPQHTVHQSLLFAVAMTILAVPAHFLLSDLQRDLMETKEWLEDTAEKDVNRECQKLAIQNLMLIQDAVKKNFETNT